MGVSQDRLKLELAEDQPRGDTVIDIIEASGWPNAEFSERIPGFIINSKF